jgi:hypothetical protein
MLLPAARPAPATGNEVAVQIFKRQNTSECFIVDLDTGVFEEHQISNGPDHVCFLPKTAAY